MSKPPRNMKGQATSSEEVAPSSNGDITEILGGPYDMTADMVFEEPDPVEVDVTIGKEKFVLREFLESGNVKYKAAQLEATKVTTDENGVVKLVNMGGLAHLEPLLVSLCLHRVDKDDPTTLTPVSLAEVNGMKPTIVEALYRRAKDICNIDEDSDTPEILERKIGFLQRKLEALKAGRTRSKNSQGATTASSV